MNALLVEHPFLMLLCACVLGFLGEWLLELFFFRRRLFETEATLRRRDREVSDLRFELDRVGNQLKNRELELEATQKARQSLELQTALNRQELDRVKTDIKATERELDASTNECAALADRLLAESEALRRTERIAAGLDADALGLRARIIEFGIDLAAAKADALTESDANRENRSAAELYRQQTEAAIARIENLEHCLAAQMSVHETLEHAVQTRDVHLSRLTDQAAGNSRELESARNALKASDDSCASLASELRQMREAVDKLRRDLEETETQRIAADDRNGLLTAQIDLSQIEARAARREVESLSSQLHTATGRSANLAERLDQALKEAQDSKQQLESLSSRLAAADEHTVAVATQLGQLQQEVNRVAVEAQTITNALSARDAELDSSRRARAQAEALLKSREIELAALERKATEFEAAFNDAADENAKLSKEISRLGGQAAASDAARRQLDLEKTALQNRLKELDGQMEAIQSGQSDLAARRDDALQKLQSQAKDIEAELASATYSKNALEAEVQAVSTSHARLESELAAARDEIEALKKSPPPSPALARPASEDAAILLNDLEAISRERNELAAELAALKASLPANQPNPRNSPASEVEAKEYAD
jgi:chromosome segregation ATPase